MTPPYAQGNEAGYVVSTTNESAAAGLFGGRWKRIDEETAQAIRTRKTLDFQLNYLMCLQ